MCEKKNEKKQQKRERKIIKKIKNKSYQENIEEISVKKFTRTHFIRLYQQRVCMSECEWTQFRKK